MMNMQNRNQYLIDLITNSGGYHLQSKKHKTRILNEYCKVTGQNRKHVNRKIREGGHIKQLRKIKNGEKQRNRESYYDAHVKVALIKCWKIFDFPCGQRLKPLLENEVDKLRKFGELKCSDNVAFKLKKISPRSIDLKLKQHKEKERLKKHYKYSNHPLLYQKIPVKVSSEIDKNSIGDIQIDFVEHCGYTVEGEYIFTLSTTDVNFNWWEGGAQLGKGEIRTKDNLELIKIRYPFKWQSIHTDNDSSFINSHLFNYTQKNDLNFSRSRPYKKNDNCFVEQKNWTHVRRCVGYLRYDTKNELELLNNLYCNELRLYKNFFQPVMKLKEKVRIGGHIKRQYDKPKTPYQRIMESKQIQYETKNELKNIYESLNPADLKRKIDTKLYQLKSINMSKKQTKKVTKTTNLKINTVTF